MGYIKRGRASPSNYQKKPAKAERKEIPVVSLSLPTFPSLGVWVRDGMRRMYEADVEKARDEAGRLRGGSVGTFVGAGTYTGNCLRASLARYLGAEPPRDMKKHLNTMLMFDSGKGSEDLVVTPLLLGLPEGYTILREDEYPIRWTVGEQSATGREDVIIVDPKGKAVALMELKAVSSLQAENVFDEKPKTEHVIQLANYMLRTGLPGQLWYRSGVIMPLPDWPWIKKVAPKEKDDGTPGVELVEWSKGGWNQKAKRELPPQPTKIRPFLRGYHLAWHEGVLYFTRASDDSDTHVPRKWVRTPITADGIDQYYGAILEQLDTETLAPPPTPIEIDGEKKTYKACDYCDWSNVCAASKGFKDWKEAVESQIPPKKKK